jgi:hypothetical protein
VKLAFNGSELRVEYVDETFTTWGEEVWNSDNGRLGGTKFVEEDGAQP